MTQDITTTEAYKRFLYLNPCLSSRQWIRDNKHQSVQWFWDNCPDADWMNWLLIKTKIGEIDSPERKKLILCYCEIARFAMDDVKYYRDKARLLIDMVEKYCKGKATLKDVGEAASYVCGIYGSYIAYACS